MMEKQERQEVLDKCRKELKLQREMESNATQGQMTTAKAVRPDNTGGIDWAILDNVPSVIAECFEHVGSGLVGVRPAKVNADLFCLSRKFYSVRLNVAARLIDVVHGVITMTDSWEPHDELMLECAVNLLGVKMEQIDVEGE